MSQKEAKAKRKADRVKVWRVDVRSYPVDVMKTNDQGIPVMKNGQPVMIKDKFDVQGSLASLLFNRELENDVEATFKAKEVADKIRAAKNCVLLDNEDMERLRRAYRLMKGIPEIQLEFFARIRDAEETEAAAVEEDT